MNMILILINYNLLQIFGAQTCIDTVFSVYSSYVTYAYSYCRFKLIQVSTFKVEPE